jgi:hypothetical protein
MKTIAALAVALCLAACDSGWDSRDGWEQSGDAPGLVAEVLAAAQAVAPCKIEPWGGWIEWVPGPFECGGVHAEGCFPGAVDRSARLRLVGQPFRDDARWSALPHELGHYVHARCDGDYSEEAARDFAMRVLEYMDP